LSERTVERAAASTSTWAPLLRPVFRALWIAVLVSNIGSWMQTVGAQWLLLHQPHAAILVSLVQTADSAPDLLLAAAGGVLADTLDRRRLLLATQLLMTGAGVLLTALTIVHRMPPELLLAFTFLFGTASVVQLPAYQALVPDLVPRAELPAASALSSIAVNIARAIGPAIAGLVIARSGVAAVFALNTLSFAVFAVVLLVVRLPERPREEFHEPFVAALRAGGRYVRNSRPVRRIYLRAALFLVPGSALWALLPLVADRRLHLGADGYGVLLGALGIGAIAGAVALPRIRARVSTTASIVGASILYAGVLAAVVLVRTVAVDLALLVVAGAAWVDVLASVNAELQLFLPRWVRARGLSLYQMVLFGSQAVGAVMWGIVADGIGLVPTFLAAGAVMVLGTATARAWPMIDTSGIDRSEVSYWPDPELAFEPDRQAPTIVRSDYTVAPKDEERFLRAMRDVRRSRLRTGAVRWGLYRDGRRPNVFTELYVVPSWDEHLRQHADRLTGADERFEETADALSHPSPETSHLIAVELPAS
jgi:MFS family permease